MGYGYPVSVPMVFDVPEGQRTARPALRELPQMEVTGPSSLETLTDIAAAVPEKALPDISKAGVPEPIAPIKISPRAIAQAKYNRDLDIASDRFNAMQKYNERFAAFEDKVAGQQAEYFNQGGYFGAARSAQNAAIKRAKAWRAAAYGMRPDARMYLTNL